MSPAIETALDACAAMGLRIDARMRGKTLDIPSMALEDGVPTGTGIGTCALSALLAAADAEGLACRVTPDLGPATRLYHRLGFAWPADEQVCPEHGLSMMVRPPCRR